MILIKQISIEKEVSSELIEVGAIKLGIISKTQATIADILSLDICVNSVDIS